MAVECFCEKIGNTYLIHVGSHEIARFWFSDGKKSKSLLSEEEAKDLAENMCEFFNTKYDTSKLSEEEWGDSETVQMEMRFINSMMEACDGK